MDIFKLLEEVPDLLELSRGKMLKSFPRTEEIDEQVYDTLTGLLIPECRLPWVENIAAPGMPCHGLYKEAMDANRRLLDRLGKTNDDEDTEIIINALLDRGRIIALKMFEYGRIYEKMQRETEKGA